MNNNHNNNHNNNNNNSHSNDGLSTALNNKRSNPNNTSNYQHNNTHYNTTDHNHNNTNELSHNNNKKLKSIDNAHNNGNRLSIHRQSLNELHLLNNTFPILPTVVIDIIVSYFSLEYTACSMKNSGYLYIYNYTAKINELKINAHNNEIVAMCVLRNNGYIVTSSLDYTLKIWNINHTLNNNFIPLLIYENDCEIYSLLQLNNNDEIIVIGDKLGRIKIFNYYVNSVIIELEAHKYCVSDLLNYFCLDTDENYVLSCSQDENSIKLWNIDYGTCIWKYSHDNVNKYNIRGIAVYSDLTQIVFVTANNNVNNSIVINFITPIFSVDSENNHISYDNAANNVKKIIIDTRNNSLIRANTATINNSNINKPILNSNSLIIDNTTGAIIIANSNSIYTLIHNNKYSNNTNNNNSRKMSLLYDNDNDDDLPDVNKSDLNDGDSNILNNGYILFNQSHNHINPTRNYYPILLLSPANNNHNQINYNQFLTFAFDSRIKSWEKSTINKSNNNNNNSNNSQNNCFMNSNDSITIDNNSNNHNQNDNNNNNSNCDANVNDSHYWIMTSSTNFTDSNVRVDIVASTFSAPNFVFQCVTRILSLD